MDIRISIGFTKTRQAHILHRKQRGPADCSLSLSRLRNQHRPARIGTARAHLRWHTPSFQPGFSGLIEMSYGRFAAMVAASTVIMFGLMYLNTFALDHVWFSQTRSWMALLMGAVMSAVMLGFMWDMYKSRTTNVVVLVASMAVFAVSLWLVRSQDTVSDVSYMKAMIPHHSIAVLTSERAHIRDPRVRRLADDIVEAQVREIGQMENLIADLEAEPVPANARDLPPRPPN
jgi:hypothetical protein